MQKVKTFFVFKNTWKYLSNEQKPLVILEIGLAKSDAIFSFISWWNHYSIESYFSFICSYISLTDKRKDTRKYYFFDQIFLTTRSPSHKVRKTQPLLSAQVLTSSLCHGWIFCEKFRRKMRVLSRKLSIALKNDNFDYLCYVSCWNAKFSI